MDIKRTLFIAVSGAALAAGFAMAGAMLMLPNEERQLIAPGSVVIERSPIEVHSRIAGTIAELRVHDGDHVAPGDVLVRLDGEAISANALALSRIKDELTARQARLRAEQSKTTSITFPSDLTRRAGEPEVGAMLTAEVSLFDARHAIQNAQDSELLDRIGKLQKEINAYGLQALAKSNELELVTTQLKAARDLRAKSLISTASLASLEREAIRLQGERDGVLGASIAQAEGRIAETRFLMTQVNRDRDAEIMRDLRDTESKLAEVNDHQRTAEDQLRRLEVTAPEAGIVALSASRSVGSLVSAGEEIITIAPPIDGFAIDASIAQTDIDALRLGQSVTVQLPVGPGQEHTQLAGTLSQIAPAASDGSSKQPFYRARIALAPTDCTRVGPVQPGTQARVLLGGNRRSVFSAVLAPVGDGIARALNAI